MRKISPANGRLADTRAERPGSSRALDKEVDAGARAYSRARDLPHLIPLWPHEIGDETLDGTLAILSKLRSALRGERRRGRGGHWSYDLNRHLGLLSAYKAEIAALKLRCTPSRNALSAPGSKSLSGAVDRAE